MTIHITHWMENLRNKLRTLQENLFELSNPDIAVAAKKNLPDKTVCFNEKRTHDYLIAVSTKNWPNHVR